MAHKNVEILRGIDEAMQDEDIDRFFGYFTDDVIVHVPGRSTLSGTYKGLEQFQALFGRFMEAAGEYSFENHTYLADDEHGVTMQHASYQKGGKRLAIDEVFVGHFRDGKVSEMWFLAGDQNLLDEFLG